MEDGYNGSKSAADFKRKKLAALFLYVRGSDDMRRVYDDENYEDLSEDIMRILDYLSANPSFVQEYDYSMMRSNRSKIKKYIEENVENVKIGRSVNTTGIGNNGAYEVICIGNEEEEQIFGILHLTNNMFGRHICWMSDIDGGRKYDSIKI